MIIEKVLGNTHDLPPGPDPYFGLHREKVVLPSAQLVKRIQRVTTDHGKELGIRLPSGSGDLRDGDILHVAETNMIVVSVLPTDVLVISPRSIHEMGVVAHSLGNRHLQAQSGRGMQDFQLVGAGGPRIAEPLGVREEGEEERAEPAPLEVEVPADVAGEFQGDRGGGFGDGRRVERPQAAPPAEPDGRDVLGAATAARP